MIRSPNALIRGFCVVAETFRFGQFELDPAAGELRRDGRRRRLQAQPLKLLLLLVRHAGTLVSYEDIRAELWGEDTFVEFDQAVHYAIRQIREALGDSAEHPLYVETIPRRGYRFIAPIEHQQQNADLTPRVSSAQNADLTPAAPRGQVSENADLAPAAIRGQVSENADLTPSAIRGQVSENADLTPGARRGQVSELAGAGTSTTVRLQKALWTNIAEIRQAQARSRRNHLLLVGLVVALAATLAGVLLFLF